MLLFINSLGYKEKLLKNVAQVHIKSQNNFKIYRWFKSYGDINFGVVQVVEFIKRCS